ncbi:hypothetical protein TWF481_002143 [Arthrobotrys musiformis]|uniref:F-box domain-containing protein n=1 Tax=Arthrobotrys musiformis TaxID=47236 RepID=A0AAV9VYF6_9PEZI
MPTPSKEVDKVMATLFDLPNELIDEIGAQFDEDDWLALRMTSHQLNAKFREYHLDSKYSHRRVFVIRHSIENLVKIAQHPSGVNLRVRHLEISFMSPYLSKFADLTKSVLQSYDTEECEAPSNVRYGDMGSKSDLASILLEMKQRADQNHTRKNEIPLEITFIQTSLKEALLDLPNLEGICFRLDSEKLELTRSELNLFYPCLNSMPGNRFPGRFYADRLSCIDTFIDMACEGWNCILSTTCAVPKPSLHYFTLDQKYSIYSCTEGSIFPMKSAFPNLKVLKVALDVTRGLNESWETEFPEWVGSANTKIEELDLEFSGGLLDIQLKTLPFPEIHTLPGLKRLSLEYLRLDADKFGSFLSYSQGSLRELTLRYIAVQDPKDSCFSIIKILNNGFRLRLFELVLEGYGYGPVLDFPDDSESDAETNMPEYLLPNIRVVGDWSSNSTFCEVKGWAPLKNYSLKKDLREEISKHDSPDEFWNSITDGNWADSDVLESYVQVSDSDSDPSISDESMEGMGWPGYDGDLYTDDGDDADIIYDRLHQDFYS